MLPLPVIVPTSRVIVAPPEAMVTPALFSNVPSKIFRLETVKAELLTKVRPPRDMVKVLRAPVMPIEAGNGPAPFIINEDVLVPTKFPPTRR